MTFKRKKPELTAPFVSMADLAFNLVLFFVILAKTNDDRTSWSPAKSTETKQVPNSRVVVLVDQKGVVHLNGNPVSTMGLTDVLKAELDKAFPESKKETDPDKKAEKRPVLLKVDKETQASTFEPIMEAVGGAGGKAYHVLQKEK